MIRLFISFILITWFATSDVFAQRNRPQQVQQITSATMGEDGIVRLPQQNDAAGIVARNVLDASQRIINPPAQEFSFMQPTEEEQKARFQQALDTLQSLLVFVNPPETEIAEPTAVEEPTETKIVEDFVPNAFVNAHYLLGMGLTYLSMTGHPDLFTSEERAEFEQAVVTYFEGFIQNGVGENSALVHSLLASLYLWNLNDPRKALMNIDRCIVLEPREPSHHIVRAQILHREGYLEAACQSLRQARQLGNTDIAVNLMQVWGCP
jgi:tetratricopeptide (TPR) repeat protein